VIAMTDTAPLDLDEPVPYNLTLLGHLALAVDGPRPVEAAPLVDEWACDYCGAAYIGPCPDDGLCQPCHDGTDQCPRCQSRFSTATGPRPRPACSSDFL
jgi:hypothetical protein